MSAGAKLLNVRQLDRTSPEVVVVMSNLCREEQKKAEEATGKLAGAISERDALHVEKLSLESKNFALTEELERGQAAFQEKIDRLAAERDAKAEALREAQEELAAARVKLAEAEAARAQLEAMQETMNQMQEQYERHQGSSHSASCTPPHCTCALSTHCVLSVGTHRCVTPTCGTGTSGSCPRRTSR